MVLLALLGVAVGVRLGWVWVQPSGDEALAKLPDQSGYLELARNLIQGKGLVYYEPRFNEHVRAMRLPGYPSFVALCGGSPTLTRVSQALLDTLTVLGVYLLSRRWLSERRSIIAAAFVAFNPFFIYFCGLILTETLFTSLLVWGMVLLARRREFLWGGMVLAMSILVRPSAALMPLVLGVAAVFVNRGRDATYKKWWPLPVGATMLLLTSLILVPWGYRNYTLFHQWVFTTTNDGLTAYDGLNPDATGASDQSFVQSMPWIQYPRMDELQRSNYLSSLAWQYARNNPRRVAELSLAKLKRTWSPIPLSEEYGTNRLYVAVGLVYGIPLYLLVALGLWNGAISPSAKAYLLLPAVYFTVAHAVSVGSLRYRVPAEAPMAVLAAACAMRKPASETAETTASGGPAHLR
jgi:4-amino-4-deoxy-L-arabinose transferase-like glycosyltransferase